MTMDARECRDPMLVAMEREARTCKGCRHIESVRCLGSLHQVCRIKPWHSLEKKCRSYSPTPEAV